MTTYNSKRKTQVRIDLRVGFCKSFSPQKVPLAPSDSDSMHCHYHHVRHILIALLKLSNELEIVFYHF